MHLPPIIQDLSIILIAGAGMALLFKSIRQPVVLGYICAGFLVGPHFKWLPTVVDAESVKVWAEIGVIFLLFSLGLEFSFKRLLSVGAPATLITLFEVIGMVGLGWGVGRALGWSTMDCAFLGGILSISSTTIIIRAIDELGMKTRGFVKLVFGVLIVEDMFAILILVALSSFALSQNFSGLELGYSVLKLGFFLVLWFIVGLFVIPIFLEKIRKILRQETLLVVAVGLCFLMVVVAENVGFSPALGAFIMGSILAETLEGERIERLIAPVKDLFAAVFFVSVGMLIDPKILVEYGGPIILIAVVTVIGKFMTTTLGALVSGQSLRHSVQTGVSLVQIGEFSFIIAGLGLSLKVTSEFLYPIVICVSALTTFATPYLIRSSDPIVGWVQQKMPTVWMDYLNSYQMASHAVSQSKTGRTLMRRILQRSLINSVMITAVFLVVARYVTPWLELIVQSHRLASTLASTLALMLAFLLSAPFIWGLTVGRYAKDTTQFLWRERQARGPLLAIEAGRWLWAVTLCTYLASQMVSGKVVLVLIGFIVAGVLFLLTRRFAALYTWMENRFLLNLNEKVVAETKEDSPKKDERQYPVLAPWDAHLAGVMVSPDAHLIGKSLLDLKIREKYGITIALIERGSTMLPAPRGQEVLFPGDELQVIGTDAEIERFRRDCEGLPSPTPPDLDLRFGLRSVFVNSTAFFANKSIRDCGLRELTHGLVVGIEKKGQRTLNPDSTTLIEPGDVLWIVGDQMQLAAL